MLYSVCDLRNFQGQFRWYLLFIFVLSSENKTQVRYDFISTELLWEPDENGVYKNALWSIKLIVNYFSSRHRGKSPLATPEIVRNLYCLPTSFPIWSGDDICSVAGQQHIFSAYMRMVFIHFTLIGLLMLNLYVCPLLCWVPSGCASSAAPLPAAKPAWL